MALSAEDAEILKELIKKPVAELREDYEKTYRISIEQMNQICDMHERAMRNLVLEVGGVANAVELLRTVSDNELEKESLDAEELALFSMDGMCRAGWGLPFWEFRCQCPPHSMNCCAR